MQQTGVLVQCKVHHRVNTETNIKIRTGTRVRMHKKIHSRTEVIHAVQHQQGIYAVTADAEVILRDNVGKDQPRELEKAFHFRVNQKTNQTTEQNKPQSINHKQVCILFYNFFRWGLFIL